MLKYEVAFTEKAQKDLSDLPEHEIGQILTACLRLETNPHPDSRHIKKLKGYKDLSLALSMLPVSVCDDEFYRDKLQKAKNLIGKRDPDDVHLLALSLKLDCPIWSNDKDLGGLGIKIYTTLVLIKKS